MTQMDESFEERFARLGAQTESVVPRADFMRRVMSRVEQERPLSLTMDWAAQVMGLARIGVAVATMAAVAVVAMAWDSSNSADLEEAMAYGVAEAFE